MATVRISSVETKYYIFSDGYEKAGEEIETKDVPVGIPPNTTLTFTTATNKVTVKGKSGLYVAISGGNAQRKKLTWSTAQYSWDFTVDSDIYSISTRSETGEKYYWFDKNTLGTAIELRTNSYVPPPASDQIKFKVDRL
ncbi:hypothetical protein APHAL10511_005848 [Amanita phalloides]|nr:hypothetical protein APHAL10511_005848 [Amanita phalloides]